MEAGAIKNPREETYWDMWKTQFCPGFSMCSFTFLIIILQLIFFVILVVHTKRMESGLNDAFFLGIQPYTLQVFGMRMPYYMKEGQIWRFVMPLLLNYGATTLFVNIVLQTVVGFVLEENLGSLRMMVFYLIAGIGGTLFATCGTPLYAAGPEPAMFGLVAGLLGWFMFYWDSFEDRCDFGQRICCFLMMVLVVVVLIYVMIMQQMPYALYGKAHKFAMPDTYAALGGFIYGLTAVLWLLPSDGSGSKCQKASFWIGLLANVGLTVILVIVFISSEPTKLWYADPDVAGDKYGEGLGA